MEGGPAVPAHRARGKWRGGGGACHWQPQSYKMGSSGGGWSRDHATSLLCQAAQPFTEEGRMGRVTLRALRQACLPRRLTCLAPHPGQNCHSTGPPTHTPVCSPPAPHPVTRRLFHLSAWRPGQGLCGPVCSDLPGPFDPWHVEVLRQGVPISESFVAAPV